MTSPALTDFGKAVRKARTAEGWTLEMLAHQALGNQEHKSYVSAVERGKKRLSPLTIQKFARVLALDDTVVDPALDHAAPQDDPTSQPERDADRLYDEMQALRQSLKISESLAIALAVKHAEGNPSDLNGALRELERAFEVANAQAQLGALPSNTDAAVDAVIAEVDRRNEEEGLEAGSAYFVAELDRMAAQHKRLIDKGLAQAVLARDVELAVSLELRKLRLEDVADGFAALREVRRSWKDRGRDRGLAFDLEVSIALARVEIKRATGPTTRGVALNDLGGSLWPLGARESGTARLEEAVAAYRAALEEWTRDRVPLDWARTQFNLAVVERTFFDKTGDGAHLDRAENCIAAAREVFAAGGASHYLELADRLSAKITARRAEASG